MIFEKRVLIIIPQSIKSRALRILHFNEFFASFCIKMQYRIFATKRFRLLLRKCLEEDTISLQENAAKMQQAISAGELKMRYSNTRFHYGIVRELFTELYVKIHYYPTCEHAAFFFDAISPDNVSFGGACHITMTTFRKDVIRKVRKTPIFAVGPYIQYAKNYYSDEKIREKKRVLGKNLLYFVTHTGAGIEKEFDEFELLKDLENAARDFDSVSVCCHWWNINDSLIQTLANKGYHIMCAGLPLDPNFLSRLRTIIELSDEVVGDGIGTHIGYCLALKRKYKLLGSTATLKHKHNYELLKNAVSHIEFVRQAFSDGAHTHEIKTAYDKYWGGDIVLTREELDKIAEINAAITRNSLGFRFRYPVEAHKLLKSMERSGDELGVRLLRDGLSGAK